MLYIIIGIILIGLTIALFKKLLLLTLYISAFIAVLIFGPMVGVAYLLERGSFYIKGRLAISIILGFITGGIATITFFDGLNFFIPGSYNNFDNYKFIVNFLLVVLAITSIMNIKRINLPPRLIGIFDTKATEYYWCYFSAFAFLVASIATGYYVNTTYKYSTLLYILSIGYWVCTIFALTLCIGRNFSVVSVYQKFYRLFTNSQTFSRRGTVSFLTKDSLLEKDDINDIFTRISAHFVEENIVVELDLNRTSWYFDAKLYKDKQAIIKEVLTKEIKFTDEILLEIIKQVLEIPVSECSDYLKRYMFFGQYYYFNDGKFFVSYVYNDKLLTCSCCGVTTLISQDQLQDDEWFCSEVCRANEQACLNIKDKDKDSFVTDATANGFILMPLAESWSNNHKLFATGGQGHGYAAEKANTLLDKLKLKDAKVVGDNNTKNGADRIVDGVEIQSKYCRTATKSVNSAFNGDGGAYRYINSQGEPMVLEVPKDQYESAIKVMEEKIKAGKVPGVIDPNEAKDIVKAGTLTYDQAKNITKFGTLDSIKYDIAEGAIISIASGGISFGLTTFIYYLNTKDLNKAYQIGLVQAGKTFTRTLAIYVTTQQLHRLTAVQNILKNIDIKKISSPSIKALFEKGIGVKGNALNKVLRGNLVTSIAIISITTGPDLIDLVRGRLSKAQFFKKLTVTSSGVAGSFIGSLAGGAIFSTFGPVGAITGRLVGGMVGGTISAVVANKLLNTMIEDDKTIIVGIIKDQIEYLAIIFILTADEIDNLNQNLERIINPDTLKIIFAAKNNRRAVANAYIKPIVISIVRQRPSITHDVQELEVAAINLVT